VINIQEMKQEIVTPALNITLGDNRVLVRCLLRQAVYYIVVKGKGKAIPLQALTGPDDSRMFSLPDFKTIGT
jgi:hypothetical protein